MFSPKPNTLTLVFIVTLCSALEEGGAEGPYRRRLLPTNVYDGGYGVYNPDDYPSMCDFHFDYFCALLNRHECTPFTPPNTCGDCFEGYYPRPFASTYPENSLCFPECSYASTTSYNHVLDRYANYHVYEDKWAGSRASDPIAHSARLKEFCTTLNREFKCPSRVCGPCKKGYINQFEISGLLHNEAACVPKCDIEFDCPSERPANDTKCFPRGEVCNYDKDCLVSPIEGEVISDNVVCKLASDGSLGWQPTFPFEECTPCEVPFYEPTNTNSGFVGTPAILLGQDFVTGAEDTSVSSISVTLDEVIPGDANGVSVRFGICEEIDGVDYKGCTCTDSETGVDAFNSPNPTTLNFGVPFHLSANEEYFLVVIAEGGGDVRIKIILRFVDGVEGLLNNLNPTLDSNSCAEGSNSGSIIPDFLITFTLNICEE